MTSAENPSTYLPDEKLEGIRHMTAETWRGRRGVQRIVEAAFRDDALSLLVEELDSAIDSLNGYWLKSTADFRQFWNIRALDWFLQTSHSFELPKLQARPSDPCLPTERRDLIQTFRSMAPLMERAEQNLPEPRLTFAANDALSDRNALLGGTMQVAGRYLARRLDEDPEQTLQILQDGTDIVGTDLQTLIMDALLEVPILNRTPSQYGYFGAANEMGWYEAGGPFSPGVVLQAAHPDTNLLA